MSEKLDRAAARALMTLGLHNLPDFRKALDELDAQDTEMRILRAEADKAEGLMEAQDRAIQALSKRAEARDAEIARLKAGWQETNDYFSKQEKEFNKAIAVKDALMAELAVALWEIMAQDREGRIPTRTMRDAARAALGKVSEQDA